MGTHNRKAAWLFGLVIVGLTAIPARAENWAEGLFAEQGHDFGGVARGAKVHHPFVLTNRLSEPITILNLRASCGCTTGKASASTVAPGQSAMIEAEMDTKNFAGKKATTLFVTLVTAGGREAEVRLAVTSNILSDIVLNPGTLDFGAVGKGQVLKKTMTIERVGGGEWQVQRMVSACRAIDASIVETSRSPDLVVYTLTASLRPNAPPGVLRDVIRVLTNDKDSPTIPVVVSAQIRGDLTASPSVLSLGKVTSSGVVQGRFLVRSSKPFVVKGVEGSGDGLTLSVDDTNPKPLHILTASYNPEQGTARGDLRRPIRVVSDLPGEPPIELTVTLQVEP